jgi:hypothetical protein
MEKKSIPYTSGLTAFSVIAVIVFCLWLLAEAPWLNPFIWLKKGRDRGKIRVVNTLCDSAAVFWHDNLRYPMDQAELMASIEQQPQLSGDERKNLPENVGNDIFFSSNGMHYILLYEGISGRPSVAAFDGNCYESLSAFLKSEVIAKGGIGKGLGADTTRQLGLMAGRTDGLRAENLNWVLNGIGDVYPENCEGKVGRLHELIIEGIGSDQSAEFSDLIASILIEGQACNTHLVRLIDSHEPLPNFLFYAREFRLGHAHGDNYGQVFQNEGNLVLWMLGRINPEILVPLYDFQFDIICNDVPKLKCDEMISAWQDVVMGEWIRLGASAVEDLSNSKTSSGLIGSQGRTDD